MKILISVIGLFSIAVGLTLLAQVNTGYVLLFMPPWQIRFSVNVFVLFLLLTFVIFYTVLRFFSNLVSSLEHARRYRHTNKVEALFGLEQTAQISYYEGRYQRAERLANEAAKASLDKQAYATNLLLAAQAAHLFRDFDRRDRHFANLRKQLGAPHLATAMTMAKLLLEEHRFPETRAALEEARSLAPHLTAALRMELKLCLLEDNPDAALTVLKQLQKSESMGADQARPIRLQIYFSKLRTFFSAKEMMKWWHDLPEEDTNQLSLILALSDRLVALGKMDGASEVLGKALLTQWFPELVERYAALETEGEALLAQIAHAESWLHHHPQDGLLLLALGRLCRRASLWGKAQNYLEASISIQPTAIAHAELGTLYETLDRPSEAYHHYQNGLNLSLRGSLVKN